MEKIPSTFVLKPSYTKMDKIEPFMLPPAIIKIESSRSTSRLTDIPLREDRMQFQSPLPTNSYEVKKSPTSVIEDLYLNYVTNDEVVDFILQNGTP